MHWAEIENETEREKINKWKTYESKNTCFIMKLKHKELLN